MEGGDDGGTWLIVPAKPFAEGKSRLSLPLAQRSRLNRAFLAHVLVTAASVLPPRRIVVVSRDADALALARSHDACALPETDGSELDDALAAAAAYAAARGARRILSLFADLPHLCATDVASLIVAGRQPGTVAIAPDEDGGGTNAMVMPALLFPYRHGSGSFWRHLSGAREAGHDVTVVRRIGLMTDIDRPEHLATLPHAFAALLLENGTSAEEILP